MARRILFILLVVVLVGGCTKFDEKECMLAKVQMTSIDPLDAETYEEYVDSFLVPLDSTVVDSILNREHSPDSVGQTLKDCINNGWNWRDPLTLEDLDEIGLGEVGE